MKERHKADRIKIRFGSLSTVIEALVEAGLIAPRETVRDGRRPERTIDERRPAGKTEMQDWLRSFLGEPVKEYTDFEAGLCLIAALPAGEAIEQLKRREHRLEEDCRALRAGLDSVLGAGLPPLCLVEAEYRLSRMEAERQFVLGLLRRIDQER